MSGLRPCHTTLSPNCDHDKYDARYERIITQFGGFKERTIRMIELNAAEKEAQIVAERELRRKKQADEAGESVEKRYSPSAMKSFLGSR